MKTRLEAVWALLSASRRALAIGVGLTSTAIVLAVAWWVQRPLHPPHIQHERTVEAELARTIAQLGGVESARVHLAIPDRAGRPSASVVVKLAAGRKFERAQADGIVHLVASSVQGLEPDAVTVLDQGGRLPTAERPAVLPRRSSARSVSGSS